ncbi:MAG: hypothetical protein Q4E24_03555 [bacterium]|nr:hypothetical protein [bacterium]
MTVQELIDSGMFAVENVGEGTDREITQPFCCDLLSVAMGRAPERGAWVTVMGNMNTLAVASLTETACIILAEGAVLDEVAKKKAKEQEITVLSTDEPIFEAALRIWQKQKEMQGNA